MRMFETAVPASACGPCVVPARDPRWVLAAAILGSSMAFLDGTVVNVALPVMQGDLRASVGEVQWIVEAYALLLAALVLVGGALGDRLGRRRVFAWGVALFALASAGCGLAPTVGALILARAVQGVGAALLVPGSLALISAAYPEERRGAAIGTWSAASAVVTALGPVAGGWVVAHASWRWLFFFNLPLAIVTLVLVSRRVAETRDEDAPPRLDLAGAALATGSLGLMVYALVGSGRGPAVFSAGSAALLVTGGLAFAGFVVLESRRAKPMVPLSLFRSGTFSGANLLTLLLYAALGGALFFVPFNLIQAQGYPPDAAGAALVPFVLLVSLLSRPAGALSARLGPRPLLLVGPLVAAAGFALLAVPGLSRGQPAAATYWSTFFPGILVLGLGMGITVAPLTTAVMGAVSARHAGVASGINNAVARAAGLLAIAGLGLLFVARFNGVLDGQLSALPLEDGAKAAVAAQRDRLGSADLSVLPAARRAPVQQAFDVSMISAFRWLMIACALMAALSGIAGYWFIEPRRPPGGGGGAGGSANP